MPEFDIHYMLKMTRTITAPDLATAEKRARELVATTQRATLRGVTSAGLDEASMLMTKLAAPATVPAKLIYEPRDCTCPDCVLRRSSEPGVTDISKGIDSIKTPDDK